MHVTRLLRCVCIAYVCCFPYQTCVHAAHSSQLHAKHSPVVLCPCCCCCLLLLLLLLLLLSTQVQVPAPSAALCTADMSSNGCALPPPLPPMAGLPSCLHATSPAPHRAPTTHATRVL